MQGFNTAAQYEQSLLCEQIHKINQAVQLQQAVIRCLVEALSQDNVWAQLQLQLVAHQVHKPWKTSNNMCAALAALGCLWTQEVPEHLVMQSAPAIFAVAEKSNSSQIIQDEEQPSNCTMLLNCSMINCSMNESSANSNHDCSVTVMVRKSDALKSPRGPCAAMMKTARVSTH